MAERFRHKYRIETTRLNGYDYTRPGYYFITICTKDREPLLGEIINEKIKLSEKGKIVSECWFDLPNHYPNIILDEFIVMPNHIHGIIIIHNGSDKKLKHGLSEFIRAFKSFASRRINSLHTTTITTKNIWQPRFYDHIIRSENELNRIRLYIKNNPNKIHHYML
jgi:putative transposase